jgi:hypothetical protein
MQRMSLEVILLYGKIASICFPCASLFGGGLIAEHLFLSGK